MPSADFRRHAMQMKLGSGGSLRVLRHCPCKAAVQTQQNAAHDVVASEIVWRIATGIESCGRKGKDAYHIRRHMSACIIRPDVATTLVPRLVSNIDTDGVSRLDLA